MKKSRVIAIYLAINLVVAAIIGWIFLKPRNSVTVSYLNKKDFVSTPSARLRHFYEPKANSIQPDSVDTFKVKYTINADTLNERYDYAPTKEKNVFRILTLGDSFTFGFHVSTANNWTELLEDELNQTRCSNINKFEVINLGVSGYDRAYATQRFIKRGVKYSPDLVIWFDFEPYRNTERIEETFAEYLSKNPSSKPPPNYKGKIQYELIAKTTDKNLQNNLIDTMQVFSKYYSGKLLLLALPYMHEPEKESLKKYANLRKSTYYFDGLPDIHKENLIFKDDGHPSEAGHLRLEQSIYKYLVKSKLINCK